MLFFISHACLWCGIFDSDQEQWVDTLYDRHICSLLTVVNVKCSLRKKMCWQGQLDHETRSQSWSRPDRWRERDYKLCNCSCWENGGHGAGKNWVRDCKNSEVQVILEKINRSNLGNIFLVLLGHFTELINLTLCFCRRLINHLDDMKKTVCGDGMSRCLLCGEQFGSPRVSSVVCEDCKKVSQPHPSAALHTVWNAQKVMYHELSTCDIQMSSHIP